MLMKAKKSRTFKSIRTLFGLLGKSDSKAKEVVYESYMPLFSLFHSKKTKVPVKQKDNRYKLNKKDQ